MRDTGFESDSLLGIPLDCLLSAAENGYADALALVVEHYKSVGDDNKVYVYARTLHQQGDKRGTKSLADCYLNGIGVKRDKRLAKDLYREAGE